MSAISLCNPQLGRIAQITNTKRWKKKQSRLGKMPSVEPAASGNNDAEEDLKKVQRLRIFQEKCPLTEIASFST